VGDLNTHADVAHHVMPIVKEGIPKDAAGAPRVNVWLFELGNFLTDLSQLRDPPAHHSGKLKVWQEARQDHWKSTLENIADLHLYLDELFGKNNQHGALAEFLMHFARYWGCERFRQVNPPVKPDDFDFVFRGFTGERNYKGFTQYWPHEHLDFPPWPYGNVIGYRSQSKRERHYCDPAQSVGAAKRKVKAYLDDEIEFCAELLTIVEQEWRRLNNAPDTQANRKELMKILALYGHVSHVVEDFFYHSNFIDLAWAKTGKPLPAGDNDVRWRRKWERRKRGPKGADKTNQAYSGTSSDACEHVYTGFFGAQDIFFTIRDALKTMKEKQKAKDNDWFARLPGPAQTVFLPFFDEDARKKLCTDEDERQKWLEDMRKFVNNADANIDSAVTLGKATKPDKVPHDYSVKALKEMCAIDRRLYKKYAGTFGVPDRICGPFAFLLELLCQADAAVRAAKERGKFLDETDRKAAAGELDAPDANLKITTWPTDNGAGNEVIGSHSLMNKDNARKKPLYPQAHNCAIRVSTYIAQTMVDQVSMSTVDAARLPGDADGEPTNTVAQAPSVDWLHLLQHFLCHPDECEKDWHLAAMKDPKAETHHVPFWADADLVAKRMKLYKRDHLKVLYKTVGDAVESAWERRQ